MQMDKPDSRPSSRGRGNRTPLDQGKIVPKVFNCIVDETALIQGAKKSTRDGIPKWLAAGRVRLFVPLYALSRASKLKEAQGRLGSDADEALQWLDTASSEHPELITLQGGLDQFGTWAEVERYAVPGTLFSEDNGVADVEHELDLISNTATLQIGREDEDIGQSFSSKESFASASSLASRHSQRSTSPPSPPTSPAKATLAVPARKGYEIQNSLRLSPLPQPNANTQRTPTSLRPLLNYILWRVHQETDPAAALDTFIFLTDNASMKRHAQRFGVRTKSLAEIRYVIARESQDARNRQIVQQKGSTQSTVTKGRLRPENVRPASQDTLTAELLQDAASDDEEILLKGAPKGPAARPSPQPQQKLLDPNNFRRSAPPTGVGKSPPAGLTQAALGKARDSRTAVGRGTARQPTVGVAIDPDSFARPSPGRGGGRGGKGGRGLWMPG